MRKVATACGIAVGSVYVYFPTKADLTAAVLTRFFDEIFSEEFCVVRTESAEYHHRGDLVGLVDQLVSVDHSLRHVGRSSFCA